ncbi:uncharacterized protein [Panulirus ornatus]|uniref:uncharacterized protein n=1 Tax=Panulirus ornatus TaxID=150431 RepID=UPI003A83CA67
MKMSSCLVIPTVVAILSCLVSTTGLVLPLVTTTGLTSSISVSASALAAGAAGGVLGLGLAALLARRREAESSSYERHRREIDDDRLDEILAMVAKVDANGCGMQYVCQVYSKPENTLTLREQTIRLLIGEKPEPVSPSDVKKPRALYQSAAVLGLRGENCRTFYDTCPLTYAEVEEYLDTLDLQ